MKGNKLVVLLLVAIVVLIGVLGYFIWKSRTSDEKKSTKPWVAVFLTNGQVYFGHIANTRDQYVKLTNIYYLQAQRTIQPDTSAETTSTTTKVESKESKVSLVKLGNELHGPTDQMNINRDQILFYEELKGDSKIVKAIEEYEAKK